MEYIPWFAWIAIVAIAAWGLIGAVGAFTGPRSQSSKAVADALSEATASQKAVTERLEAIDTRLAAIEKTLNDIP